VVNGESVKKLLLEKVFHVYVEAPLTLSVAVCNAQMETSLTVRIGLAMKATPMVLLIAQLLASTQLSE
jgi:predicted dehydrogenase